MCIKQTSRFVLSTFSLSLLVLTSTIGCKSQSTSIINPKTNLQNHALLESLPKESIGFFIWNLDSPSYKQFSESPWGSSAASLFSNIGDSEIVSSSFDALNKSVQNKEFWKQYKTKLLGTGGSTYFNQTRKRFELFLKVDAKSNADATELAAHLKSELENELFSVSEADGIFSAIHGGKELSVFYAVSKDSIIAASEKSKLVDFLNTPNNFGIGDLVKGQLFQDAVKRLPARDKEYFLGFLNSEFLLSRLPKGSLTSMGISTDLPISAVALNRSIKDSPHDSAVLLLDKSKLGQNSFLNDLETNSNLSALDAIPAGSAVGLGIDGSIISTLANSWLSIAPNGGDKLFGVKAENFSSILSLALGFEDVAPGALFPSLCLSFSVSPDSKVTDDLKTLAQSLIQTNAGMQIAWQQKAIQETKTDYILTPFGVGLYIAELPTTTLLSSSEPAMAKMITSLKTDQGFNSNLPDSIKALTADSTFFRLTLSFPEIAKVIRNLSGSLSMFTGGQALLPEEKLKELESFGLLSMGLDYKDNSLLVQNHYAHTGP